MNTPVYRHAIVMVIDDNPIEHFILDKFFRVEYFAEKVLRYENAVEALSFLSAKEDAPDQLPSIIFLDINMPFMNGFRFIDAFSQLEETVTSKCSIVMVSSSIYEKDLERAKNSPFVKRFIDKPITNKKLEGL